MRSLVLTLASLVLLTEIAAAAPGDPRLLKGTLEWPATLATESVAVIRGDDGTLYYVDASTAERLGAPITGRVSVVGIEGMKPQELSAVIIGGGDSALTSLETPTIPGDVAASPRTDSSDDLWRVQGKVRAVTIADIIVETPQGQSVRVDASKLSPWTRQTLRPGDEVKLYGVPQADRRLVANGFIQLMPSVPSASPASR
ncbi:MAG TPA: hypothetical protein VGR82_17110 [Methylomirabilota bacterium]|jgi:hypothetical protein|nr:hypothetical protein [Methylomirabilota bacterium]